MGNARRKRSVDPKHPPNEPIQSSSSAIDIPSPELHHDQREVSNTSSTGSYRHETFTHSLSPGPEGAQSGQTESLALQLFQSLTGDDETEPPSLHSVKDTEAVESFISDIMQDLAAHSDIDGSVPCSASIWSTLKETDFDEQLVYHGSQKTIQAPTRTSSTLFSDNLEKACVMYICQLFDLSHQAQASTLSYLPALKQKYCHRVSHEVLNDLSEVAVAILGSFSNLDAYLYGVVSSFLQA